MLENGAGGRADQECRMPGFKGREDIINSGAPCVRAVPGAGEPASRLFIPQPHPNMAWHALLALLLPGCMLGMRRCHGGGAEGGLVLAGGAGVPTYLELQWVGQQADQRDGKGGVVKQVGH